VFCSETKVRRIWIRDGHVWQVDCGVQHYEDGVINRLTELRHCRSLLLDARVDWLMNMSKY